MSRPHIIGVAGGSGSGKTYFAKELQKMLGSENCSILYQDNYYIDQSARFDGDGGSVNFDHPQALDFTLLARGLQTLKMGQPLQVPIYDFVTHSRKTETLLENPKKVIIVDGILILHSKEVRAELDEAVFFDTPEDLRFQRRLHRDVHERGRTPEGVKKQFELQVRPMHDEFVEPSKRHAQTIVTDSGDYHAVLSQFTHRLQNTLPVR
ncbi:uridine kinase [Bdellovibrio bacteriovorus]|uniref:uridine/cytidine kinase n=1 Tax=Bdellovibrio bacteriovorus (strain ATCC 15356 / DSM 50701 / NCIMB 9529 / HD100) TaxID=264462 RepID=Q6MMU3_BDEBA|nr:uridine kinase [Bdellovibrio bacteriovorus]CAE79410.1 udk [Bdellovibrio bacteriovorus HD100]